MYANCCIFARAFFAPLPMLPDYNALFAQALTQLNTAQRRAVEQIEGPVMVVAGPGTGKTQVLALRIGQILTQTDTQAHNILCLTFTDAGVRAMRERLLSLIGAAAHRVGIYTFHSFCNKVVQENIDLFGRQEIETLTDLERVQLVRELLDALPADNELRQQTSDPYAYERHLQHLFKSMKAEDWTAESVLQQIERYEADLPNQAAFVYQNTKIGSYQKGELKTAKIAETHRLMRRLRAAVALQPYYETLLKREHRYDFEDMIAWTLRAFERFEFLLRQYQEQYLYLLVDEFQDTNGAQQKLLGQLLGFWENPNIFVVGDDDQAIYEFQGARLKNLTDFYAAQQPYLATFILTENYRSSQKILDAAERLIARNELRLVNFLSATASSEREAIVFSKKLLARGKYATAATEPTVVAYPNKLHEAADIVAQLMALQASGASLGNSAILYAQHRSVNTLLGLLEQKKVPYQVRREVNILDLPIIAQVRTMLQYFQMEQQRPHSAAHWLFQILHFPYFDIALADISTLAIRLQHTWDDADEPRPKQHETWRSLVVEQQILNDPKVQLQNPAALQRLGAFLRQGILAAATEPVTVLSERVLNQSGLLTAVLQSAQRVWLLQVLSTWHEHLRGEAERHPRWQLAALLQSLQSMDTNRIALKLVRQTLETDGVQLLTAHSAKGLEFERVWLIDAVETQWERSRQGSQGKFKLPDTLTLTGETDGDEARRRLFYVAVTRAKWGLQVSFSDADEMGRSLQRSQLVSELGLPIVEKTLSEATILDFQIAQLREMPTDATAQNEREESAWLDEFLRTFRLSATSLAQYLDCPLSFYYQSVLQVPSAPSEAMHYGTAAHYALQRLFLDMQRDKNKAFADEDTFIRHFQFKMEGLRGNFSRQGWLQRLERGRLTLRQYYRQNVEAWSKNVRVEHKIQTDIAGVPVKGTLDKIEYLDAQTACVVDYKTSKPNPTHHSSISKTQPHGGRYWRQLVFYKLLYENYRAHLVRVPTAQIAYLEPNKSGVFENKTLQTDADAAQKVTQMIQDTWANIQNRAFKKGCDRPDCVWCNLTKHNFETLPDTLHSELVESMDEP
jgi:DNA helicase II / ATP-dependent DNA helicase PcrA